MCSWPISNSFQWWGAWSGCGERSIFLDRRLFRVSPGQNCRERQEQDYIHYRNPSRNDQYDGNFHINSSFLNMVCNWIWCSRAQAAHKRRVSRMRGECHAPSCTDGGEGKLWAMASGHGRIPSSRGGRVRSPSRNEGSEERGRSPAREKSEDARVYVGRNQSRDRSPL